MNRMKITIACLFIMGVMVGSVLGDGKVVIVPGLTETEIRSVTTYIPFFSGVENALKEQGVAYEYYHVGLDNAPDDDTRMAAAKEAISKIKSMDPDVIVAVNDNVVKFIGMQFEETPVVAGYFFGSAASLGLPTKNITGVERRSFAVDVWSIAKQVAGVNTVSMISKDSYSMQQIRTFLLEQADTLEKLSGVRMKEMYLCNTFDEWKNLVKNWSEDLIYLADTTRLMEGDKEVPTAEVVQWTVDNATVPVVGANTEAARDGALFAMVTSEAQWGNQVANMVIKILNGTPVSDIPIEKVSKGKLLINAKTAITKNIDIPYEILNSADHIYE